MDKNRYILIMAGGVGSRFWPASRETLPKQFLDILGIGKSLIQTTFERINQIIPAENILVATNAAYKDLVMEHLPLVKESNILLEPSRNNTAPCIAYAALKIQALNPDASFGVLPSDHVILKETAFIEKMDLAFDYAEEEDAIVTLGIQPTRPDTGYGYIHFEDNSDIPLEGIKKVRTFKEKPDVATAQTYLDSGEYLWNAGIFIWHTQTILNSFKANAVEIYDILSKGNDDYNQSSEQAFIDEHYPTTPNISVDYAILEKSSNVFTIPAEIGWSDLGTWNSLHDYLEKDETGNVIQADESIVNNTKNTFIKSGKNKILVVDGLDDYIVIDQEDALLIYPKSKEQEIKEIRKGIKKDFL